MLAQERHNIILSLLHRNGAVSTSDLVERFGVALETIRRDLLVMEQNGLLNRVHGGAIANSTMMPFRNLEIRHQEHGDLKREAVNYAVSFVHDGEYIHIDSGSTAIYLAEALKEKKLSLTVITYSSDVFEILRDREDFTVILCGGQFMRNENAFCGHLTLNMLNEMRVQKAFLLPDALSLSGGICAFQHDFCMLQQMVLKQSDEVYVLADSSKFEKKALFKVDEMRSEYMYVTDSQLPAELQNFYRLNNLKIFCGKTEV